MKIQNLKLKKVNPIEQLAEKSATKVMEMKAAKGKKVSAKC